MLDFFKKLLPNFEKRRLLSYCDKTEQLLSSNISGVLLPIIEFTNQYNLRGESSPLAQRFYKATSRSIQPMLNNEQRRTFATILFAAHERALEKMSFIKRYVDKNFDNMIATNGLSFQEVEVIRLSDLIAWFQRYSTDLLHAIVIEESNAADIGTAKAMTKYQLDALDRNFMTFIEVLGIVLKKETDFEALIKMTSNIIVAEATDESVNSQRNVNLFRTGFMPVIGDAILMYREWRIERDNLQYERNKYIKANIELRILAMKEKLATGSEDDKLRRTIEKNEQRVADLSYQIYKYEQEAGVYDL